MSNFEFDHLELIEKGRITEKADGWNEVRTFLSKLFKDRSMDEKTLLPMNIDNQEMLNVKEIPIQDEDMQQELAEALIDYASTYSENASILEYAVFESDDEAEAWDDEHYQNVYKMLYSLKSDEEEGVHALCAQCELTEKEIRICLLYINTEG